jgi:RNA polymerase sigma factor (sigma-70 family)
MSALREAQPAPTCSEHALISAVRRGDDRAFEELYARYRPRIASYVLGMVGDHQRAEDIAQEVFIAALRRLRATERPIAFKPWIYEIAKNACIDDFRRARRTREVSLDTDTETAPPARLIAHGADMAVEHKQQLDDLRGAFSGLSESHHRIIVMRELEGRSYSQIGESLGISKPVVESTLFRARRKLSEEYEELVTGRRCERVQTAITTDGDRPLRRLGIKERRLLARHLAHCQSCRRHARVAGIDESFFKTPSVAARIAALLPLPWLRRPRSSSPAPAVGSSPGSRITAGCRHRASSMGRRPGRPHTLPRRRAAAPARLRSRRLCRAPRRPRQGPGRRIAPGTGASALAARPPEAGRDSRARLTGRGRPADRRARPPCRTPGRAPAPAPRRARAASRAAPALQSTTRSPQRPERPASCSAAAAAPGARDPGLSSPRSAPSSCPRSRSICPRCRRARRARPHPPRVRRCRRFPASRIRTNCSRRSPATESPACAPAEADRPVVYWSYSGRGAAW